MALCETRDLLGRGEGGEFFFTFVSCSVHTKGQKRGWRTFNLVKDRSIHLLCVFFLFFSLVWAVGRLFTDISLSISSFLIFELSIGPIYVT